MTDAVKLLTEAEAIAAHTKDRDEFLADLRERGLIAEETDNERRLKARKVVADYYGYAVEESVSEHCAEVELVLKGMEMRAPLTREMVREALRQCRWSDDDHFVDRFLAALAKEQS